MNSPKYVIRKEVESWLDEIVIGLEFCPFAERPRLKGQIHFCISNVQSIEGLMLCVVEQSHQLIKATVEEQETTLIIVPNFLENFDDYLDALCLAEQVIETQGWSGILQIASFHPQYQFEETEPSDVENLTNRSPYPIFHLLREESVSKATDAFGDTAPIPERNKKTLTQLSTEKRKQLFKL